MITAVHDGISDGLRAELRSFPHDDAATLRRSLIDQWIGDEPAWVSRDRDRAAHMLLHLDRPARVLDLAVEHLVTETGAARGDGAYLSIADDTYLPVTVSAEPTMIETIATTPLPNQHPLLQTVWRADQPLAFGRVRANRGLGTLLPTFERLGTSAMLAVAIRHRAVGLGMLCLDEVEGERSWTVETTNRVDQFVHRWLGPVLGASLANTAHLTRLSLTLAERESVQLLAEGMSYAEIARTLGKSVRTVDNQLRSARAKTGARNSIELLRRSGLLSD